ncbi:MAG: hypothetical protein J6A92_07025 [Lachnospiraceae bacterium]|nr:hypothetical protein [Lachnospiraceae bacterium]
MDNFYETEELLTQITDYFDKSYKTDKDALESLLMLYEEKTQEFNLQISALRKDFGKIKIQQMGLIWEHPL